MYYGKYSILHLIDFIKLDLYLDFLPLYFPQVKLKRRGTKLQQDIQDRLGKIEKMRHSVNPSKENPKEERVQTEAHVRQMEEEVAELQKKTAELQQLSQTDDNLQFLQACLSKVKCPFRL